METGQEKKFQTKIIQELHLNGLSVCVLLLSGLGLCIKLGRLYFNILCVFSMCCINGKFKHNQIF